ncbi:DnaJ-domain-containing protein [Rozella allomycis CSF55]|uniref:DNAJ-containing protein, X-domain-containing protein n=1 Tax=Rozella allomycis (strain CSF55) TaxID=988480 RepID=A0A075AWU6_ROZAC|nr:DNAJ-containing protein, X- domain-containing protein [Rozella allomycis CSF55]RKP19979.1 DnaJ-domain-containing protein [Rozella allomycis CSF55]|eukprot:EPZ33177.1 DNAJ-containing protein, X- domain-containing protein [Rozella allomycis CSF55]
MLVGQNPACFRDLECLKCHKVNRVFDLEAKWSASIECYFCKQIFNDVEAKREQETLYSILGVPETATSAEIKKQYRMYAVKYHPDKNLDNPNAEEQFKKINEAYLLLSDDELRARYDDSLKNPDKPQFELDRFFSSMFGGDNFVPWIGTVSIGKMLERTMSEGAVERDKAKMNEIAEKDAAEHEKRIKLIKDSLKRKIESFAVGSETEEQFKKKINEEATILKEEPRGKQILKCIAYVYRIKVKQAISKTSLFGSVSNFYLNIKEKGHMVSEVVGTIKALRDVSKMAEKLSAEAENTTNIELEEKNEKLFMHACWKACKMEIEAVARESAASFLEENKDAIYAKGLDIIAEIFESHSKEMELLIEK